MRGKFWFAASAGILTAAILCLAIGAAVGQSPVREAPVLFKTSKTMDGAKDPANDRLTEAEVKAAVQRWWNDKDHPLNITKVKVKDQETPARFSIRLGNSIDDWKTAYIDPQLHPGVVRPMAVPVVYRIGPVSFDLLFIIDRGAVIAGPFDHYKRSQP